MNDGKYKNIQLMCAIDPSLALKGGDESVLLIALKRTFYKEDLFDKTGQKVPLLIIKSEVLDGDWEQQAKKVNQIITDAFDKIPCQFPPLKIVDCSGVGSALVQHPLGPGSLKKIFISGGRDANNQNERGYLVISKNLLLRELRQAVQKGKLQVASNVKHSKRILEQLKGLHLEVDNNGNIRYISPPGNSVDDWVLCASYLCHFMDKWGIIYFETNPFGYAQQITDPKRAIY